MKNAYWISESKSYDRYVPIYDHDKKWYDTHGVVAEVNNLNRVRQVLATCRKHAISGNNLMVMRTEDGRGFRILAYCYGHSAYLPAYAAGILYAVDRRRKKRKRRKCRNAA